MTMGKMGVEAPIFLNGLILWIIIFVLLLKMILQRHHNKQMKDIILCCDRECAIIFFQYHLDTFQPETMIIFVRFRSDRQTI